MNRGAGANNGRGRGGRNGRGNRRGRARGHGGGRGAAAVPAVPPPPAPVVPAAVPTACEWSIAYMPKVPEKAHACQVVLDKLSVAFIKDGTASGPHPASHAVREKAVVHVLAHVSNHAPKLISVWGADRDIALARKLEAGSSGRLRVYVQGGVLVPQDINRRRQADPRDLTTIVQREAIKDAMVCDVYCATEQEFMDVIDECFTAGVDNVYWIGHNFAGAYGTTFGEGAWYKTSDGKIVSRPDQFTDAYPPHWDAQLLMSAGVKTLPSGTQIAWSPYRVIGTYVTVVISRSTVPLVIAQPPSVPLRVSEKAALAVPANAFQRWVYDYVPWRWVSWLFATQMLMLNTEDVANIKQWLAGKQRGEFNLRQLCANRRVALLQDPEYQLLFRMFPDRFQYHLEAVVLQAYAQSVRDTLPMYQQLRVEYAPDMQAMNEAVKHVSEPVRQFSYAGMLTIGCVAVTVLRLEMRHGVLRKLVFYSAKAGKFAALGSTPLWSKVRDGAHYIAQSAGDAVRAAGDVVKDQARRANEAMQPAVTVEQAGGDAWASAEASNLQRSLGYYQFPWPIRFFGVAFEETLKHGPWGKLGLAFVVGQEVYTQSLAGPVALAGYLSTTGIMHVVTHKLPFFKGCVAHFCFNEAVAALHYAKLQQLGAVGSVFATIGTKWAVLVAAFWLIARGTSRFQKWRHDMYEKPWEERQQHEASPRVNAIAPSDAWVPRQEAYVPEPKEWDDAVILRTPLPEDVTAKDPGLNQILLTLPTSEPIYVPAYSPHNDLTMIINRIAFPPPMDPEKQGKRWRVVPDVVPVEEDQMVWEDVEGPYLDHCREDPMKNQRVLQAKLEQTQVTIHEAHQQLRTTVTFVKANESLCKPLSTEDFSFNPRAINSVGGHVQYAVGPYIFEASKRLKKRWHPSVLEFQTHNGILFHYTYGSPLTSVELTQWYEMVTSYIDLNAKPGHKVVFLILAGDDAVGVLVDGLVTTLMTSDFSKFDHTQREGPLAYQLRQAARQQVPKQVRSLLWAMYAATIKVKDTVLVPAGRVRRTGGPDTTDGNTKVNAGAQTFVLSHYVWTQRSLVEGFGFLGLVAKCSLHYSWDEVSFLKGAWWPTATSRVWSQLPSRVVKVGKALDDPRRIFKVKDLYKAAGMHLASIANGYASFPQVPILGAFVARFKDPKVKAWHERDEQYKVSAGWPSPPDVDREGALELIMARYGITAEEVREIEVLLTASRPLTQVENPAFEVLAARDYA